jgi:hypothetical protein
MAISRGLVDLPDSALDKYGCVVALLDFHSLGQGGIEAPHFRFGGTGHIDGIGGGLLDDPHSHHGDAVAPEECAVLFGAALDTSDIPQANQVAVVAAGQDQAAEVLCRSKGPLDPHRKAALLRLDASGR